MQPESRNTSASKAQCDKVANEERLIGSCSAPVTLRKLVQTSPSPATDLVAEPTIPKDVGP